MFLYSDLELNNDIKKIKSFIGKCSNIYKDIGTGLSNANKTYTPRFSFIFSQFKNIFKKDL